MMTDTDRHRLLGKYRTPRFKYGDSVACEVRGEVVITGLSNAPIPWPVAKRPGGRARTLAVYGDLADAVRRESASAVAHWWGVTDQTVWKWRKVMGVGQMTEGTQLLKSKSAARSPKVARALKKAWAKAGDPERRRKIAESRKGKPRPDHVVEAMRRGRLGKPHSEEARRKMSEAKKGRPRPPRRDWTRDEDDLLGEMTDEEVARRTGRTVSSVKSRRKKLEVGRYED